LKAFLFVFLPHQVSTAEASRDSNKSSWTCVRNVRTCLFSSNKGVGCVQISDIHHLHRELVPYVSWIKGLDLPSQSKNIFLRTPNSKQALEKAKTLIQVGSNP